MKVVRRTPGAGVRKPSQFRKSQRERYRAEIDCDFFAIQAAIDQIGLLGRLITYLVQEFCEWRRRRGTAT
jgi:hypothetical protein